MTQRTARWGSSVLPGVNGIAVGCFVDADSPVPGWDLHCRYRQHWLTAIEGADAFDALPPTERSISQGLLPGVPGN